LQVMSYKTPAARSSPRREGCPLIPPDERLRRLARQLHRLGERPLYEFLAELAAGADPIERLEVYSRIDPEILRLHGGNNLPRSAVPR
jgi:hypothetical protein